MPEQVRKLSDQYPKQTLNWNTFRGLDSNAQPSSLPPLDVLLPGGKSLAALVPPQLYTPPQLIRDLPVPPSLANRTVNSLQLGPLLCEHDVWQVRRGVLASRHLVRAAGPRKGQERGRRGGVGVYRCARV